MQMRRGRDKNGSGDRERRRRRDSEKEGDRDRDGNEDGKGERDGQCQKRDRNMENGDEDRSRTVKRTVRLRWRRQGWIGGVRRGDGGGGEHGGGVRGETWAWRLPRRVQQFRGRRRVLRGRSGRTGLINTGHVPARAAVVWGRRTAVLLIDGPPPARGEGSAAQSWRGEVLQSSSPGGVESSSPVLEERTPAEVPLGRRGPAVQSREGGNHKH